MDQGKFTGAVFVDLSKAFNMVDHGCILSKLKCYGVKEKELCWFESYSQLGYNGRREFEGENRRSIFTEIGLAML